MTEAELQIQIDKLAEMKSRIKLLEASADAMGAEIMAGIFEQPGVFQDDGKISYQYPGYGRVAVETKTTRTVNVMKLVASGVEMAKIAAATDVTESKPFVRLYKKKQPGDLTTAGDD